MSTITQVRWSLAVLGAFAAIAFALTFVSASAHAAGLTSSNTIFACVKRHSGATRIVKAKTRCRHGEQKLSWSITGPSGPSGSRGSRGSTGGRGADGKAGAAGSNGAVAVYSARREESLGIVPTEPATVTVLVSKTVPPGNYSVSAKTVLVAEATKAGFAVVSCSLVDTPGVTFSETHATLDVAGWEAPLGERVTKEFKAVNTLSASGVLTSTVTSTLSLLCINIAGAGGPNLRALSTQLSAIQASAIS